MRRADDMNASSQSASDALPVHDSESSQRARVAPTILLADDVGDAREMYREALEHSGFRVVVAEDGAELVRLARETPPDLVVTDLAMPAMDGVQAARTLRGDGVTAALPIIALTALDPQDLVQEVRDLFDAYLVKPCLPEELETVVRTFVAPLARAC
jgi:CheY-like chemotaxis protein